MTKNWSYTLLEGGREDGFCPEWEVELPSEWLEKVISWMIEIKFCIFIIILLNSISFPGTNSSV